ncbi:MAG TPA: hypothetical protein VIF62_05505 [Labilithrix sp.]
MRLLRIATLACAAGAIATTFVAACLDVEEVFVPPRDAAASDGAPCLACLLGDPAQGGCADKIDTCEKDSRCQTVYTCMATTGCFERVQLDDKIACTLPCLQEAGILTVNDPVVETLLVVVQCGQKGCTLECNLPEAGIDLDGF